MASEAIKRDTIAGMILDKRREVRSLGGEPVEREPWEEDDDGLMYANSLQEQIEGLRNGVR